MNATDPWFHTLVHPDIFQTMVLRMKFSPQHHVNMAYTEAHPEKYPDVVDLIEGMGLCDAMTLQCH